MSDENNTKETIGFRLRLAHTGTVCWWAPGMSSPTAKGGKVFTTAKEARDCRATCNDVWQQHAKVVRVVRTKQAKSKNNALTDNELKFVHECELTLAKATPGPMDLHRIDQNDGTIAYQMQQSGSAPKTTDDIGGIVITQFDDSDNANARNDAMFYQHARENVRRLCMIIRELDLRR